MKILVLSLFFLSLFVTGHCQDTIYSINYPKGIVTKSIEKKNSIYIFNPINNPSLKVKINEKNVFKIKYFSGETFINPATPQPNKKYVILPTDPMSGDIFYSDIMEFGGVKSRQLYNSIKKLSGNSALSVYSETPPITFILVEADTVDFTYQQYVGSFPARYIGDHYTIFFQLETMFKDGRMKYEYTNFISVYNEQIGNNSITTETYRNFFDPTKLTTNYSTKNAVSVAHIKKIDKLYAIEDLSDIDDVCRLIPTRINESITALKKLASESTKIKKNDW
jgi:hypothetical protein